MVRNQELATPFANSSSSLLKSKQPDGSDLRTSLTQWQDALMEEEEGLCPICMDHEACLILDECQHAFCESCIAEWFHNYRRSLSDRIGKKDPMPVHCAAEKLMMERMGGFLLGAALTCKISAIFLHDF